MPFRSEEQRRYLWAKHPNIARKWTNKYGSTIRKAAKRRLENYRGTKSGSSYGR